MSLNQKIDIPELRKTISQILNIEENGDWHISSYDPENDLYCVHADKMDLENYKDLRGIIVSTQHNKVIARSHGFSPLVISNHLDIDENGTILLKDIKNVEYKIKKENYSLKYCLEGTQIRVMRFAGKTYFMTHRQLDFSRSRWIVTRTFKQLFESLKGPKEEDLFDLSKPYSPYCYFFLIHHPEVLNVCRDDVLDGNLVYIGRNTYWNAEELGINPEEISNFEWNCPGTNNIIAAKTTRTIYDSRESIPVDKAQNYLNFGFVRPFVTTDIDPRIRPGESIIVKETDDNGNFVRLIKVQSESYYWRAMIKGDNPNLFNQFFKLATNALNAISGIVYKKGVEVNNHQNYLKFRKTFPRLDKCNPEILEKVINQKKLRVWMNNPKETSDNIQTLDDRLYNVWAAFLMVVPIHRQPEVFSFLERFKNETNLNIRWLHSIENVGVENYFAREQIHPAVKRIVKTARHNAKCSIMKGQLPPGVQTPEQLPMYQILLRSNIAKLMRKERGASRYGIMLNRRLITAKNEVEKKEVRDELDSFFYDEADFPDVNTAYGKKKYVEEVGNVEDREERKSENEKAPSEGSDEDDVEDDVEGSDGEGVSDVTIESDMLSEDIVYVPE